MESTTQQVKGKATPARYILVTLQQPSEDACVKRTGLLVGFGGKENTMIGLEVDKALSLHESDAYAITKVEWNFGKKHRVKFFEPTGKHTPLDNHMKGKAFELVKRLFGNITTRLGLEANQCFGADKLYSSPPKHTGEEIVEPKTTKIVQNTKSTAKPAIVHSAYPDGGNKTTYVPPQQPTTTYTTKPYKKSGPTMFRRTSTERVKARVAAISARLDELFALKAVVVQEPEEDNTKGPQNEPVAPEKEQVQSIHDVAKYYAAFCGDCRERKSCLQVGHKVNYCSYKVLE